MAVPLSCCFSVAAVFVATLLPPCASAGASQTASLQAEATQLSQEMLLEQLQIAGYEQQRTSDIAQAASDQEALAATQTQLAATRQKIAQDVAELQTAAVASYIDDGTAALGTAELFSTDPAQASSGIYEQVLTDNLTGAVAQLQSNRKQLRSEEVAEQELVAEEEQKSAQATVLLTEADNTQLALQQQSNSVDAQLAAAIEQQQEAEEQAARLAEFVTAGSQGLNSFLSCVLQAESGGNYEAVSPTGQYMGGFQFSQSTWNEAAELAGMSTLVGVPPYDASPADQNALALALYEADGEQPWYDPCTGR